MKRIIKTGFFAIIALIGLLLVYTFLIEPVIWRSKNRSELIAILKQAIGPDQQEPIAGGTGLAVTYPDGSWLTIRYRDTHAGSVSSIAIAHDSAGGWHESTEHYCALLGAARDIAAGRNGIRIPEPPPPEAKGRHYWSSNLAAIVNSETLNEATHHLKQLGFSPIAVDAK